MSQASPGSVYSTAMHQEKKSNENLEQPRGHWSHGDLTGRGIFSKLKLCLKIFLAVLFILPHGLNIGFCWLRGGYMKINKT